MDEKRSLVALFAGFVAVAGISLAAVFSASGATSLTHEIMYSLSSERSNPALLDGESVNGSIYVFTDPADNHSGISKVEFYLDGVLTTTERFVPYDFKGGSPSAANPWDTTTVGAGSHSIRAKVYHSDGITEEDTADFTIGPTGAIEHEVMYSLSNDRSSPATLNGQTVAGEIYVFTDPADNHSGISKVEFYLDGILTTTEWYPPYDFKSGSEAAANPWDTTTVGAGSHSIRTKVYHSDGVTEENTATFSVSSARALPSGQERFADLHTGYGGASVHTYPSTNRLTCCNQGTPLPGYVKVGGVPADTHYARLRWLDVDIPLGTELWLHGRYFLPSDFYSRQESYVRIMYLDNFNLDPANPRRLHLVLYGSDHVARLMRQRQGMDETLLCKAPSLLPTGRVIHLAMRLVLSQTDGQALSELYVDGVRQCSSTLANVTAGATASARFTRAGFGMGGATDQETKTLELYMDDVGVTGTRPLQ